MVIKQPLRASARNSREKINNVQNSYRKINNYRVIAICLTTADVTTDAFQTTIYANKISSDCYILYFVTGSLIYSM